MEHHALFSSIWLLFRIPWIYAAWRWGDWRNWRIYLATIQYMLLVDLVYFYLTFNYPLWRYDVSPFGGFVTADLLMLFIVYPSFVLIYLSHYPSSIRKQFIYVGIWFIVVALMEWTFSSWGLIHYYHGWNRYMSFAFDLLIFFLVRLHFTKPLLTYLLTIIFAVFLLSIFHVPIGKVCSGI